MINKIHLIFFLISYLGYVHLIQNENYMNDSSIVVSQDCISIDNLNVLKKYILNNGISPSSIGPPFPVIIYHNDTIQHNEYKYSNFYKENKELEKEEIQISNNELGFSYIIKIENNTLKLEYENSESFINYEELGKKYKTHFCEDSIQNFV